MKYASISRLLRVVMIVITTSFTFVFDINAQESELKYNPEGSLFSTQLSTADSAYLKGLFDSSEVVRHVSHTAAASLLTDALAFSREKQFSGGVAHALIGLAGVYTAEGRFRDAAQALRSAWPYCFMAGGKKTLLLVNWYNNASSLLVRQGNFAHAYRYLDYALSELRTASDIDSAQLVLLYTNIAAIWHKEGTPGRALQYLEKARATGREINVSSYQMIAVENLTALSYDRMEQYDSALIFYRRAIDLAERSGNGHMLRNVLINMGNMYTHAGILDSAEYFLKKGLTDKEDEASPALYFYLAKIYLLRKDHKQTFHFAYKALEAASRSGANQQKALAYKMLAVAYSESGAYRQSLRALEQYMDLNDSINNIENQRIINELDVRYRSSEKDLELTSQRLLLAQKEQKLQQTKFMLWGVAGAALMTGCMLFVYYRYRQRIHNERIKSLEKDQEIKRLNAVMEGEEQERSRIAHELHDGIVSQLTAVKLTFSSLLQQDQPDKTAFEQGFKYLDETMQDLRKTAHNLMPETVIKSGLLKSLEDFCNKMDNEYATRIHFMSSGVCPPLEPQMALSVYRMIQELVQNALKYANAANILVQVNCQPDLLDLTVEDDGCGFKDPDAVEKGTGLYHIRQRLAALGGVVEFISSENGLTVYAEVPVPPAQNV